MGKKDEQNSIDAGIEKLLRRAQQKKEKVSAKTALDENETKEKLSETENSSSDGDSRHDDAKKAFRKLTGWEDGASVNVSLRTIVGGDILAGRWFRRHLTFLFTLVFLAILYVSNRYQYQQEMIDNRKLTLRLEDRRLRAVVATSNLTEYLRRSNISSHLCDTTLKSSPEPFYYLQTD